MNPAAQNSSCIAHIQLTWNISMSESLQSLERWCRATYFEGWIVKYSYVLLHWLSMRSAELLNGTCTILRPARNSPNSRDHRQFNFVFIPSQKFSFSHHNNFSYDIKAYSPFRWSSTHFVRTSGVYLVSFSFVINIIDSLRSDFRCCPIDCWDSYMHIPSPAHTPW